MKKILFIALVTLIGCTQLQSNQKRAESLVKGYLDSVLNDPHSYESVNFDKLDTSKTRFTNTPQWDSIETKQIHISSSLGTERMNEMFPDLYNHKKTIEKIRKLKLDSAKYSLEMDAAEKNFKSEQDGWYITHKYRAKNGFGALGLHSTMFKLNMALTKVIDMEELRN